MNIDLCYHPSVKPGISEKKNSNSEIKCLSCLARANSFCKCIAQDKLNDFSKISSQRKRIGWQDNPIVLPMTRNEMADYLGLTVETVSREITKLKSEQIIKMIDSKQVFLNNKPLLESEL